MSASDNEIRRARSWLGTVVEIRVRGMEEHAALEAIELAFREIATIHRLMSFHEGGSDLSRLNAGAFAEPLSVDVRTREVLALALTLASESGGRFDPTVAAELVAWGLLPVPGGRDAPEPGASWCDVVLLDDSGVRFNRPLWLDLGGIAKGYAVDRAIECLVSAGAANASVNGGGDLRLTGTYREVVHVRLPASPTVTVPLVELSDASLATSAGYFERRRDGKRWIGPHVDGRLRRAVSTRRTVSVVAPRCAIADALTKVVLCDARFASTLLQRHGASALLHDPRRGWRVVGEA